MNSHKSKVMVFERSEIKVIDYDCPHPVRVECLIKCATRLNGKRMEELYEMMYLGLIPCKYGSMHGR